MSSTVATFWGLVMKGFALIAALTSLVALNVACKNEKSEKSSYAAQAQTQKNCENYPACTADCNNRFRQCEAGQANCNDQTSERLSCLRAPYNGKVSDASVLEALIASGLTPISAYPEPELASAADNAEFSEKLQEGITAVCDDSGNCSHFIGGRLPASL